VPTAASDAWVIPLADAIVETAIQHGLHALSVHYAVGLAEAAVLARDRLAARGHALRVCVTLHGSDVTAFAEQTEQRDRLRTALSRVDRITAVSAWLAAAARSKLGLASAPRLIPNAVDTALFFPDPRADRVPGRPAVLCHASNFREIKRPLDNVDVLARVLARGHDARLTMIGDGPLRTEAESRAHARDVAGRTTFVGPVAPAVLAGHLRRSDIVLVTSASESFSLVALEAMASGAVLVGTRCGGLEELLGGTPEWCDRLLAEPGDIEGLATRVGALLADPALFLRARDVGLSIARGSFAQDEQLAAYADVLRGAP
jgi:N-acetyl-alpha-D-glucosaminyl L-malate synthase BshA